MKLHITILKYHSWHLCQISLQIMLLPILMEYIEITSWKAPAYGIFTRVGEVSEIERMSAANE